MKGKGWIEEEGIHSSFKPRNSISFYLIFTFQEAPSRATSPHQIQINNYILELTLFYSFKQMDFINFLSKIFHLLITSSIFHSLFIKLLWHYFIVMLTALKKKPSLFILVTNKSQKKNHNSHSLLSPNKKFVWKSGGFVNAVDKI